MPILISDPESLIYKQIKQIKSEISTLTNSINSLAPDNHFDRNTDTQWLKYYEDLLYQYEKLLNGTNTA